MSGQQPQVTILAVSSTLMDAIQRFLMNGGTHQEGTMLFEAINSEVPKCGNMIKEMIDTARNEGAMSTLSQAPVVVEKAPVRRKKA